MALRAWAASSAERAAHRRTLDAAHAGSVMLRCEGRALRQWSVVARLRSSASAAVLQAIRRWESSSVAWSIVHWSRWSATMLRLRQ
eukprot:2986840-Prymnesium_polylepis.1